MLMRLVITCSEKISHAGLHLDCCVCSRLVKEATKDVVVKTPSGSSSAPPAADCPTAKSLQPEETTNSAEPVRETTENEPPVVSQEAAAVVEDIPPSTEQASAAGEDIVPPGQDQTAAVAGGNTTIPPLDAEAEGLRRMDEVVGELPPFPLKLLVLAFLIGDSWKQTKASETADPEEIHEQPQTQAPAGTSSSVSTRKNYL
jgi:hypothetical protein